MNAEAKELTLLILALGAAMYAGTALVMSLLLRAIWTEKRRIRCPVMQKDVDVTFSTEAFGRGPIDVEKCSYFSNPRNVTCRKECLHEIGEISRIERERDR
jgi:hypothetical protein